MSKFSPNRIFLIGYMASGKSTVGRLLAQKLNMKHIDTDDAIVHLAGMSINELFDKQGEASFRAYESKITHLFTELDKVIVSTGGGLPVYNDNMDILIRSGLTIYLRADADIIKDRIVVDGNTRPIHNHTSKSKLAESISQRLLQREPIYREAHLTIDANQSIDKIIHDILDKL